jgi:hypothetical protein
MSETLTDRQRIILQHLRITELEWALGAASGVVLAAISAASTGDLDALRAKIAEFNTNQWPKFQEVAEDIIK